MQIDVHPNAEQDLAELEESAPAALAAVLATLEELEADPNAIDKLTTRGNNDLNDGYEINVKRWESATRRARAGHLGDLWRFRALDTPATTYRVIYGFNWYTRQVCILGIALKSELDYDDLESGIGKRVLADWAAL
jgi:mRNA-degrading endonuclease RelE of RelBE toxin-antitoxin system